MQTSRVGTTERAILARHFLATREPIVHPNAREKIGQHFVLLKAYQQVAHYLVLWGDSTPGYPFG